MSGISTGMRTQAWIARTATGGTQRENQCLPMALPRSPMPFYPKVHLQALAETIHVPVVGSANASVRLTLDWLHVFGRGTNSCEDSCFATRVGCTSPVPLRTDD